MILPKGKHILVQLISLDEFKIEHFSHIMISGLKYAWPGDTTTDLASG